MAPGGVELPTAALAQRQSSVFPQSPFSQPCLCPNYIFLAALSLLSSTGTLHDASVEAAPNEQLPDELVGVSGDVSTYPCLSAGRSTGKSSRTTDLEAGVPRGSTGTPKC